MEQSPIPPDVGWQAPVAEVSEPPAPLPVAWKPSAHEKVWTYEQGQVYKVDVGVHSPLDIWLDAGEELYDYTGPPIRAEEGEERPPWEFKQSKSHAAGRQHLLIGVTRPGMTIGLTLTTSHRVILLELRSVATSKVRVVRWQEDERPMVKKPRLLPDPTERQSYHVGYAIWDKENQPLGDQRPTWTPRQIVDNGKKTFVLFPVNLPAMETPMVRAIGSNGYELVNARLVDGSVMVIDHLVHGLELRVGSTEQADVVRIWRGPSRRIDCPGHDACPVWPQPTEQAGVR
jgi:type IV secretion system protein TrbG